MRSDAADTVATHNINIKSNYFFCFLGNGFTQHPKGNGFTSKKDGRANFEKYFVFRLKSSELWLSGFLVFVRVREGREQIGVWRVVREPRGHG